MTGISDDAKALQAVFLEEASEILGDIERDLLELETSPGNRTLVDGLFRHLHTMKGSAGVAGMEELAHYTHAVESMLDEVRNGRIAMSSVLASLLLEALDCLKSFIAEALGEGPLDRHIVAESHRKIWPRWAKAPAAASTPLPAMPATAASPTAAAPPNLAVPEPAVASEANPFIIQVLARPDFFPRPSELAVVSRSLERFGKLITISHEQSLPSDDRRQGDTIPHLWRSFHLVTTADRTVIAAALADWSILHRVTIDQVNAPPASPADQARLDAAVDGVSQDVIGDRDAPVSAPGIGAELPPAVTAEPIPLHARGTFKQTGCSGGAETILDQGRYRQTGQAC